MLLALGQFVFSLHTAPFSEMDTSAARRWAFNERFGKRAAAQDLGPDEKTLALTGSIAPEIAGKRQSIADLEAMMNEGRDWTLTDGQGHILGKVIILRISHRGTYFVTGGIPRITEFTIELKWVD